MNVPERRSLPILAGLCSITFRHLSAATVAALAAASDLDGIEWGADRHLPPGETGLAHDLAKRCESLGLACPSYGSYLRAGELGDDDTRTVHAAVSEVMNTAVALGAPNVRVWCRWLSPGDATDLQRQRIIRDLRLIADMAAKRSLTVSLEHHVHTLTETAESSLDLLDRVGAENLYTYWQPVDGLGPNELVAELAALHDHLSHLHVFRWRSFEDRLPLAHGEDIWPHALRVASAPGRWTQARWAFLEYVKGDDPDQLEADAATLRGWLQPQ